MAQNFDMRDHRDTWERFTKLATFGSAGVVILLVLMAIFLL